MVLLLSISAEYPVIAELTDGEALSLRSSGIPWFRSLHTQIVALCLSWTSVRSMNVVRQPSKETASPQTKHQLHDLKKVLEDKQTTRTIYPVATN